MLTPSCSLIVLRVASLDRSASFYAALSITFDRHQHGSGPEHLAAPLSNGTILELYPKRSDADSTAALRLGFTVEDLDHSIANLTAADPACVTSPPKPSDWGRRAIARDPDGHTIELLQL